MGGKERRLPSIALRGLWIALTHWLLPAALGALRPLSTIADAPERQHARRVGSTRRHHARGAGTRHRQGRPAPPEPSLDDDRRHHGEMALSQTQSNIDPIVES